MLLRIGSETSSNSYCSLLFYISGRRPRSMLEKRAWGSCLPVGIVYIGRHKVPSTSTFQQLHLSQSLYYTSLAIMDSILQHPVIKTSLLVTQWLQQNDPEYLAHILQETSKPLHVESSVQRPEAHPIILAPTPIRPPTIAKSLPSPPTPQAPAKQVWSRRHHRTATPEQRSIRFMMGGKPIYTMGMNPQEDRCLLFDFFEQIRSMGYRVHGSHLLAIRSASSRLGFASRFGWCT
jgi:hypothetical protein